MENNELDDVFKNFDISIPLSEIPSLFVRVVRLEAELRALKKYTVRKFLNLNGLEFDELPEELEQEHEIIDTYKKEIQNKCFLEFFAQYGKPAQDDKNQKT